MTNLTATQVNAAKTIASAYPPLTSNTAKSWFVPPIVVPAFLMVLIIARALYSG